MAVTIHDQPQQYSPSDNPITFVFSSNQTAQANFSYIIETYLDAVKVAEDRIFPEVGARSHFDASPVVKNLLTNPSLKTGLYQEAGTSGVVSIKIIENYGTPPTDHSNATSSNIKIFKACLSDRDFTLYDYTDWQNTLLLTNRPRTERIYVQRGVDFYLNMIQDASKTLTINLYGPNGGLLDTYTSGAQSYVIAQVNTNTTLLQSVAGFAALDLALAAYYTVQIGSSEEIEVYFYGGSASAPVDLCGEYSTLMFLNEWGAFDSFVFGHNVERKGSVTDRRYGRKFGGWNGTSYQYNLMDAGDVRIGTSQIDSATIYTDWITQTEQNWLIELYKSSRFAWYDKNDNQYAVRVTSNQFSYQLQRFEELISEAVDFEFVNSNNGLNL